MTFRLTLLTALPLAALAFQATAQDSSGTITGTYNADNAVWTIGTTEREDVPSSGWRDGEDGRAVIMSGQPGAAGLGLDTAFVIRFTLARDPEDRTATEPSVWLEQEGEEERLIAGPENIDISITALDLAGDSLTLAGDLVAMMTPGGTGEIALDDADTRLFDGNFQATLQRLERAEDADGD